MTAGRGRGVGEGEGEGCFARWDRPIVEGFFFRQLVWFAYLCVIIIAIVIINICIIVNPIMFVIVVVIFHVLLCYFCFVPFWLLFFTYFCC